MNKKMKRQKSILPGALGVRVIKTKHHPKGDINFALRSFKKDLKESGKLQVLKDRTQFEKPAVTRRLAKKRRKYIAQQETLKRI